MPTADNGTGASCSNGTASFLITSINGPDLSIADIETTHLGTTGARTYMAGDLTEGGTVSLDVEYDPGTSITLGGTTTTWTLGYPLRSGQATAANLQFAGYINAYSPSIPLEDKMTATVGIKVAGPITRNAGG